ncbi:HAD-IA family hydrolase [Streptomyces sp. NPDC050704]|uniref:HAD family hydrolase n=1 Tax=Streptomyces sp. NPDC050704 TaxID=3157219 RepID=UPI003434A55E
MAELTEQLRRLITGARFVLFDFDGPICRLFAGHSSERVAAEQVRLLEQWGLHGLLTPEEQVATDPHVVLRAVDSRHPDSDLVIELEKRLTSEELKAVDSAYPTPYVDPLIRTWHAKGARLAIATNNSPVVAARYLDTRGLVDCFAPHIYGRTQDLSLLKPNPHCLKRALSAMGAESSGALMVGDTPTDFEAAQRADVPFLGYARHEKREEELRKAGAAEVVTSLEPVLRILRQ